MRRTTDLAAAAVLAAGCLALAGCASGDAQSAPATVTVTAPAPTESNEAVETAPSPDPTSAAPDCDPHGDLSQAEWAEFCADDYAMGEGPTEELPANVAELLDGAPEGSYWFEYMGAWGLVETDVSSDDERVAKFEAYRERVGGSPVNYAVVEVDNTDGTENINMYGVTVIDEDGAQLESTGVSTAVDEWSDLVDSSDTDTYNAAVDLSNDSSFYLLPGAKGEAVMVFSEEVGSPSRVHVMPAGGFDIVEAYEVSGAG